MHQTRSDGGPSSAMAGRRITGSHHEGAGNFRDAENSSRRPCERVCTEESGSITTAPQCDSKWPLTDLAIIKATLEASVKWGALISSVPASRCAGDNIGLCSKGKSFPPHSVSTTWRHFLSLKNSSGFFFSGGFKISPQYRSGRHWPTLSSLLQV